MRIVTSLTGFYEWDPVPEDVAISQQDIDTGRVKPAAHATPKDVETRNPRGYVMRVTKNAEDFPLEDRHNMTLIPENQIVAKIIHEYVDHGKCGSVITRAEAVAKIMGVHVVPHQMHPKHMVDIEVEDDGPSEELARAMIAPHVEADHGRAPGKNVEAEDVEPMIAAYMEPCDSAGLRDYLRKFFKLKPVPAPEVAQEKP